MGNLFLGFVSSSITWRVRANEQGKSTIQVSSTTWRGLRRRQIRNLLSKTSTTGCGLVVLRKLTVWCEQTSGQKDFAYRAARSYFAPGGKHLASLFEIFPACTE